jgi:hypothetical protein
VTTETDILLGFSLDTSCGINIGSTWWKRQTVLIFVLVTQEPCVSGSLSPRHGASSGCGWRNCLRYGG